MDENQTSAEQTTTPPAAGESNEQSHRVQERIEEAYREQVLMAGYDFLSDLRAITYHQSGDGLAFMASTYGLDCVVEELQSLADRVQAIGTAATQSLAQAIARWGWAMAGRVKWCANCGGNIEAASSEWQICRGLPEHIWCHLPNATSEDEDRDRAGVLNEAEEVAYCEDRMRNGGPHHGDSVELTFPDGRQVQGAWYVPGPAPLGAPIVLDWSDDSDVSPADAQVQVIGTDAAFGGWVLSVEDLRRREEFRAQLAQARALTDRGQA